MWKAHRYRVTRTKKAAGNGPPGILEGKRGT